MIGIYKITNKILGKCYIGQSGHIERRFVEHCNQLSTSQISLAIQEYGKENFDFSIIEECSIEELDAKEEYWINYYNCVVPYGYNVIDGSFYTSHTNYNFFSKDTLLNIIADLKENFLSIPEIAKKYGLHKSSVYRINSGEVHYQENIEYPIRPIKPQFHHQQNHCIDCGIEISLYAIRCNKCNGLTRRENVPISREELKSLIRNVSFVKIGEQFSVTDNAIRKWCKKYKLPTTKKEIKSYSNEEWDLI